MVQITKQKAVKELVSSSSAFKGIITSPSRIPVRKHPSNPPPDLRANSKRHVLVYVSMSP
jgi:hypothetical protein